MGLRLVSGAIPDCVVGRLPGYDRQAPASVCVRPQRASEVDVITVNLFKEAM